MSSRLKRIGAGAGVVVLVLAAVVVAMFAFGKPMTPQAPPQAAASAEVAASQMGEAPTAPQQESTRETGSDPLAVEIPGCVCHSDDPALVEEHASYRMSECFECHRDGMPEMGQ